MKKKVELEIEGTAKYIDNIHSVAGSNRVRVIFDNKDESYSEYFVLSVTVEGFKEAQYKNIVWKIKDVNKGIYVDENDFTGGRKVELAFNSDVNAGPISNEARRIKPRGDEQQKLASLSKAKRYLVEIYEDKKLRILLETVHFALFSEVYVKGVINWTNDLGKLQETVSMDDFIYINIDRVVGLIDEDIIIRIFNVKELDKVVKEIIHKVDSPHVKIPLAVKENLGFCLDSDEYIFTLHHHCFEKEVLIYKNYTRLKVYKSLLNAKSQTEEVFDNMGELPGTTPAGILLDEFFTQRYESCRYNKIISKPNGTQSVIVFDEKDLIKGDEQSKIRFKVLDSVAKPVLNYKVEGLITDQCKNNPEYQVGSGDQEHKEPHSNKIFDVLDLESDYIKYRIVDKTSIDIYPDYNYVVNYQIVTDFEKLDLYDLCRLFYWYNPFNIKNQIKEHSFRIVSCRYNLQQIFYVIPDINWTVHLFFFNPDENHSVGRDKSYLYYRNFKNISLDSSWVESYSDFCKSEDVGEKLLTSLGLNKTAAGISSEILSNRMLGFINAYIISIMKSIKYGMHAYIKNGNEADIKPTIIIDYGAKFEFIRFMQILNITLLNIALDILILWFTRGKNLPVILARIQKVVKYTKMAIPKKLTSKEDDIEFIAPQIGMNFGGGYRYGKDGIAYNVIEYTLAAEPLFGVKYDYTKTAGDILASTIGIDTMFKNVRSAVSFVGTFIKGTNYVKGLFGKKTPPTTMGESINRERESLAKNPLKYFTSKDINEGLHTLEGYIVEKFDDAIKKHIGLKTEISLLIEGYCDVKINLAFNLDKQVLHVIDKGKESKEEREVNYGHREGVKVIFKVSGEYKDTLKVSKLNEYIPDFIQTATGREFKDTKTDAKVEGEVKGAMHYERTYKYSATDFLIKGALGTSVLEFKEDHYPSSNPPVYIDRFVFTGIIGTIYVDVKVEDNDKNTWEYQKSKKDADGKKVPVPFTIIPSYVYESDEKPVFPDKLSK